MAKPIYARGIKTGAPYAPRVTPSDTPPPAEEQNATTEYGDTVLPAKEQNVITEYDTEERPVTIPLVPDPEPSFAHTFRTARDAGATSFLWGGKLYNTRTEEEVKAEQAIAQRPAVAPQAGQQSIIPNPLKVDPTLPPPFQITSRTPLGMAQGVVGNALGLPAPGYPLPLRAAAQGVKALQAQNSKGPVAQSQTIDQPSAQAGGRPAGAPDFSNVQGGASVSQRGANVSQRDAQLAPHVANALRDMRIPVGETARAPEARDVRSLLDAHAKVRAQGNFAGAAVTGNAYSKARSEELSRQFPGMSAEEIQRVVADELRTGKQSERLRASAPAMKKPENFVPYSAQKMTPKRLWDDWQAGVVGTTGATLYDIGVRLSNFARKGGADSAGPSPQEAAIRTWAGAAGPFLQDVGASAERYASGVAPKYPTFTDKVVQGIASTAAFYVPGLGVVKGTQALGVLSPIMAKTAGTGAMAGLEAAAAAQEVRRDLIAQGVSEEGANDAADKAFLANLALLGVTDFVYFTELKNFGAKVLARGAAEGPGQEGPQYLIQRYLTQQDATPEGFAEASAVGAIATGAVTVAEAAAEAAASKPKKEGEWPSLDDYRKLAKDKLRLDTRAAQTSAATPGAAPGAAAPKAAPGVQTAPAAPPGEPSTSSPGVGPAAAMVESAAPPGMQAAPTGAGRVEPTPGAGVTPPPPLNAGASGRVEPTVGDLSTIEPRAAPIEPTFTNAPGMSTPASPQGRVEPTFTDAPGMSAPASPQGRVEPTFTNAPGMSTPASPQGRVEPTFTDAPGMSAPASPQGRVEPTFTNAPGMSTPASPQGRVEPTFTDAPGMSTPASPQGRVEPGVPNPEQAPAPGRGVEPLVSPAPMASESTQDIEPVSRVEEEANQRLNAAIAARDALRASPTATGAELSRAEDRVFAAEIELEMARAMRTWQPSPAPTSMPPGGHTGPLTAAPGTGPSAASVPGETAPAFQGEASIAQQKSPLEPEALAPAPVPAPYEDDAQQGAAQGRAPGGDGGAFVGLFGGVSDGDTVNITNIVNAGAKVVKEDLAEKEAHERATRLTAQTGIKHVAVKDSASGQWSVVVPPVDVEQTKRTEEPQNAQGPQPAIQPAITLGEAKAVADLSAAMSGDVQLNPVPSPALHALDQPVPAGFRHLTPFEASVFDAVGRVLGITPTYFNNPEVGAAGVFTDAHPNRVFINTAVALDDETAPIFTLNHEIWHALEEKHPEVYAALRGRLRPYINETAQTKFFKRYFTNTPLGKLANSEVRVLLDAKSLGALATANARLARLWAEHGHGRYTPRGLIEREMLSDLGANRMGEKKFWAGVFRDLGARHGAAKATQVIKNLVDQILAAIKLALENFGQGKFTDADALLKKHLEQIRDAFTSAMAEVLSAEANAAQGKAVAAGSALKSPAMRIGKGNRNARPVSPDVAEAAAALVPKLVEAAAKGGQGKYWYEDSAAKIMQVFNGDLDQAEKFIRIIAITSADTDVGANTTFALRAWQQFAKGEVIQRMRYGSIANTLNETLYLGRAWNGTKTNTFYVNLMEAAKGNDTGHSTHDLHMSRLLWGVDAPTRKQYAIMEEATQKAASILDVLPRQLQAMAWVSAKTDSILSKWAKQGPHKSLTPEQKLEKATQQALLSYANYLDENGATSLPVTEVTRLADEVRRRLSQEILLEAIPSESLKLGRAVAALPFAEKRKYTSAIARAVPPQEVVQAVLGRSDVYVSQAASEGGFQPENSTAKISPNIVITMGSRTGVPISREDAKRVAEALGDVYMQDGVPYARHDESLFDKIDADQEHVKQYAVFTLPETLSGSLTLAKQRDFFDALHDEFGDYVGYTHIPGTYDIAFGNYGGMDLDEFALRTKALADKLGLGHVISYAEGGYAETTWTEDDIGRKVGRPGGEARAERSPDLQKRLDDWRNEVVQTGEKWLRDHGYGDALKSPRRARAHAIANRQYGEGAQEERYAGSQRASYGQARPGSIQVTGVHYSLLARDKLDSSFYGTGMRGAERDRLELPSATKEQFPRIYFYVDEGNGITPEDDVGHVPHEIELNNLYHWNKDPEGLLKAASAKGGTFGDIVNYAEQNVMAAGYDGYYVSGAQGKQGAAVLLGKHIVPTRGGRGVFSARKRSAAKSPRRVSFYSQLQRTVEGNKQKAMPGAQWKSWLNAAAQKAGVKKEEIQWSGVLDYLELRGAERVTRDELLEYLRGNNIEIKVLTRKEFTESMMEDLRSLEYHDRYGELTDAEQEELRNLYAMRDNSATYSSYVPPGGQKGTYHEVLVTAPKITPEFESSHWHDANVLVHYRADEVKEGGKRYLRVIEIQSDWGQAGRKKGFLAIDAKRADDIEKEMSAIARRMSTLRQEAADLPDSEMALFRRKMAEVNRLREEYYDLERAWDAARGRDGAVPKAPFVQDTKAWVALGIKQALRDAIERGADGVMFATGQENADLYNLSKYINFVTAKWRAGTKTWQLEVGYADNKRMDTFYLTDASLADHVGKDLAKKIIADRAEASGDGKVYSGLNLKVGGAGMIAFYDDLVPQVANEVLRKIGSDQRVADHRLDITPAMRAALETEGLPLFNPRRVRPKLRDWADKAGKRASHIDPWAVIFDKPPAVLQFAGIYRPVLMSQPHAVHILHVHPEITPDHIGALPDLLTRPRAILTHSKGLRVLLDDLDARDNVLAVGLSPDSLKNGTKVFKVTEVSTIFGLENSAAEVARAALENRVIYLPKKEVARLQDLQSGPQLPMQTGMSRPSTHPQKAAEREVSIPSDEALHNFKEGLPGRPTETVLLSEDAPRNLQGARFNPRRYIDPPITVRPEAFVYTLPAAKELFPPQMVAELERIKARYSAATKDQRGSLSPEDAKRARDILAPLMAAAEKDKPDFDRRMAFVAQQAGALGIITAPVKGEKRAAEKLVEDYAFEAPLLRDLLRGTIVVSRYDDVPAVVRAIQQVFAVQPGRLKNRTPLSVPGASNNSTTPAGYADFVVNVDMPGVPAEIQINTPAMLVAKKLVHDLYALERSLPKTSPDIATIQAEERAVYDAALAMSLRNEASSTNTPDLGKPHAGVSSALMSLNRKTSPEGISTKASPPSVSTKREPGGNESGTFMGEPPGGKYTSAPASPKRAQTETPEFKRWFGNRQSVDAAGRPFEFSDSDDMTRSPRRPTGPVPPAETKAQAAHRTWVDTFSRFKVLEAWGGTPNDLSVYKSEVAMHGRTAARIQDFREKVMQPFIKKAADTGIPLDTVAQYVHAVHAPERNAQIAKINPAFPDGGSGMLTKDAQDIVRFAKLMPNFDALQDLADDLYKIIDSTKRTLLDAGIINQDMIDAWEGAYQHYVPLMGGPDEKAAQTGTGKGLSVRGKQKRALGHTVRDEYIIENVMRAYERAVVLSEKNRVMTTLVDWLEAMNNPNLGTVGEPEKRAVLMPGHTSYVVLYHGSAVATFESAADAADFIRDESLVYGRDEADFKVARSKGDAHVAYTASPMLGPNEFAAYKDGEMIRVQLNDALLARAVGKMGVEQLGKVLSAARHFNAYLSKAYTGRNPDFIVKNMLRDFQAGLLNLTGEYGATTAAEAAARYPSALLEMFAYSVFGRESPTLHGYRMNGGSTGAGWLTTMERIAKDVGQAYEDYQGAAAALRAGKPGKATWVATRKLVNALTGWIEHLNAASENAMRYAVYQTVLRKTGDTAEAVHASKSMTVNFDKRGEVGQQAGAMYLFFNPAINGSYTIWHAAAHGAHKKQLWALVGGAIPALGFLTAALLDADDDDEGISRYERARNIIIPLGDGRRLTIPMPYGYSFFFNVGQFAYDQVRLKEPDYGVLATDLALSFQDNFSPVKLFNEDGFQPWEAVPGEPLRMVMRLSQNQRPFGGSIVPENKFDPYQPDSAKMFRRTVGSVYDDIASWANAATGGSPTQKGAVDVSPETLRFWWDSMTGGAGAFVENAVTFAKLAASEPSAIEPRDVPFVRGFLKERNVGQLRQQYLRLLAKAREAEADVARAHKGVNYQPDYAGAAIAAKRHKAAEQWLATLEAYNDWLRDLGTQRLSIMRSDASVGEKRLRLKMVEDQERAAYISAISGVPETLRDSAR